MLCKQRREIAQKVIKGFLENKREYPTISSINEGGCGDFAHLLNEAYQKEGLRQHQTYCTFDFISPTADGVCEYLKDWKKEALAKLGVSPLYFEQYRKKVEAINSRCVVGYHVWLFDGQHHYDATCLKGVKNPLDLPFFQLFVKK